MRLAGIAMFPVKSARGLALDRAEVTARGLDGDRRWMLVDARGRCVTQRELPALARLAVRATDAGLLLAFEGESLEVSRPDQHAVAAPVSVWDSTLLLREARGAREWLTRSFGQPLRLFFQPDDIRRAVGPWGRPEDHVSLADEFPLLIASTSSLGEVGRAAGLPIGIERFRPNLVMEGAEPWAEDAWARLRVGTVELELLKPCPRCTVTTVDQARGAFSGGEPLATLRRIRMSGDRRVPGVLFGWNAVPRRLGTVRVGDPVEVLETRPAWPIRGQTAEAV